MKIDILCLLQVVESSRTKYTTKFFSQCFDKYVKFICVITVVVVVMIVMIVIVVVGSYIL